MDKTVIHETHKANSGKELQFQLAYSERQWVVSIWEVKAQFVIWAASHPDRRIATREGRKALKGFIQSE